MDGVSRYFKIQHPLQAEAEFSLFTSWVDEQVVDVSDDQLDQFQQGICLELFVEWLNQ